MGPIGPAGPAAGPGGVDAYVNLEALAASAPPEDGALAQVLWHGVEGDGGGGLFRWVADADEVADGGLSIAPVPGNGGDGIGRWRRVVRGPLRASWWGLLGDGSDQTAALQAMFEAAAGKTLIFDSPGVHGFRGRLSIPDDVRVLNNGSELHLLESVSGNSVAVAIGEGFSADHLAITLAPAVQVERLVSLGARAHIKRLRLDAEDLVSSRDDNLDGALQIREDGVHIERLDVRNFIAPVFIYTANDVSIDAFAIENYITGIKLRESSNVRLSKGITSGRTPLAATEPGHNAILIDRVDGLTVSDMVLRDAGEHGVRVGGSGDSSNLNFDNIEVIAPGQCGLKINPADGSLVRAVQINGLTVVDAAATSRPGSNEDGLRLEKCLDVSVTGFQVISRDRAVSAFDGIFINGCQGVNISSPRIFNVANDGIHIVDDAGASNSITITSPTIRTAGMHGVNIESETEVLRDIVLTKAYINGYSEYGLRLVANSPTVGVNQPVILDGWVKRGGKGALSVSTSDADVHRSIVEID